MGVSTSPSSIIAAAPRCLLGRKSGGKVDADGRFRGQRFRPICKNDWDVPNVLGSWRHVRQAMGVLAPLYFYIRRFTALLSRLR